MDAPAMAQDRLVLLRRAIARIEGRPAETLQADPVRAADGPDGGAGLIRTGIAAFDARLGGGLAAAALTELRAAETRHAASLLGFALCLTDSCASAAAGPLLWLTDQADAREAGLPYWPGICGLGGRMPGHFMTAATRTTQDALWVAEEAAASGAFAAVLLELRGNPKALGLDETRRLQRRAALSGRPVILLRVAGLPEATAAPCRLLVAPAPSGLRHSRDGPMAGSIGPAAFTVTIEKARAPSCQPFLLEWNQHDRRFRIADKPADSRHRPAAPFDRPDRPPALGPRLAQPRAS